MSLDGRDDIAVAGQHGLDPLAGVKRELVDRRQVCRIAHGDGHHLASPGAGQLIGKDVQLLGDLLADTLHRARIDLQTREPNALHPEVLGQRGYHRLLAAKPLLYEDAAQLAAPLLLVSERALELVLVDDSQFGEQLSEALARRHRVPVLTA